ncbi:MULTISPECIES: DUF1127 domain-containing protein [unclassified Methylobacterium]|uniref:DUF1127 domain-containing protein n=1 Tax=unclassified Methylobacterium TaxID=2615210 RepID=UPI001FB9F0A8|nr:MULTISPECIES: DUF1127 domain-containing protein [unclassified Methylobacterium]MCJ2016559.1 DUF1127 domain-containing protein [Methylobacterium sp. E-065]
MIFSYLTSARKARTAARNYRILSALDDAMLGDIGLDRQTLRMFCDNGCTFTAISAAQTGRASAGLSPLTLQPILG